MPTNNNETQDDILSNLDSLVVASSGLPQNQTYFSRTVAALDNKATKPQETVVCQSCTAGLWFSVPGEVKCFCQRMRSLSWQTHKPIPVTNCDGWSDQLPDEGN